MTTTVDTLVKFFTGKDAFDGLGIVEMKNWYEWGGLDYEETVRLKQQWMQDWRRISAKEKHEQDSFRLKLATEIVVKWGGISGNTEAKLAEYIKDIEADPEMTPFKGIATRSKLLPLLDPGKYVIMDARVVIALRA